MTKIKANISIDGDLWEAAKKAYPDKLSAMFENYLIDLLGNLSLEEKQRIKQEEEKRIKTQKAKENLKKLEKMGVAWRKNNPLTHMDN